MKTRRNHGSKYRMTVNSSAIATYDTIGRNNKASFDPSDCLSSKDPSSLHETRSQKFSRANGQEDSHAETKEPTSQRTDSSSTNVRVSTRSSSRPQKRQRKSSPSSSVQNETPTTGTSKGIKKTEKKGKRPWESWSQEDKNAFFDALHEHGKDFDKIQVILQTRHKRRGDPKNLIKNKDQVRHFYYRTLNKISKYVPKDKQFTTETDPHQRTVLELRSLTCFGELRKRVRGLGEKQGKKLHELLEYGSTTIRQSGRNARLKAPTCRALKRLTLVEGKCDETCNQPPPVPSKLDLEFCPLDNTTWLSVQGLSKNPRLKTTISSKKPLSLVITFLAKKWPVKSSKPNEFLALCIAVPVEYLLPQDAQQNETAATESRTDGSHGNHTVAMDTTESPLDTNTHNAFDTTEVLATDLPSPSSTTVNSTHTTISDTEVAGSTDVMKSDRQFWTATNCGNITIGDIYCKLQRPPKLKFEYLFQQNDSSPVNHSNNALQKLVNIAKAEFVAAKKAPANKATSNKASSGRNLRIAPKASEKLPFILPSIFQPAPRLFNHSSGPNSSSSFRTLSTPSFVSHRKRIKKNQQMISKPTTVVQRKLLPHPVNAMPPGAVAVSFIPQPIQTISPANSPGIDTINQSPDVSPKTAPYRREISSTTVLPASLPTSPTTCTSTSKVITTVLESGIQPQPLADHSNNTQNSSGLNELISNSAVSLPEVDHLIHKLQEYTAPRTESSLIDTDISGVGGSLQLDPAVTINEDSNSDLIASIIELSSAFPPRNPQKGHIQELVNGSTGPCTSSFNSSSFIDILSGSHAETVSSVASNTATTPSLFFNSVSENSNDGFTVSSHDKTCLSPSALPTTLFATSQLTQETSPSSPAPDSQWLNGESDLSLSFFDKLGVSPEKEPKFGFDVPSLPFPSNKDCSQDLFGGKAVFETAQAEKALRAIMDENSVDLVKKFQDLTKQFSGEDKSVAGVTDSNEGSALSFKNLICKPDNTNS